MEIGESNWRGPALAFSAVLLGAFASAAPEPIPVVGLLVAVVLGLAGAGDWIWRRTRARAKKSLQATEPHPLQILYDNEANAGFAQSSYRKTIKYVDRMSYKHSVQKASYSFGVRNTGRTTARNVSAVALLPPAADHLDPHRIVLLTQTGKESADIQPGNTVFFGIGHAFPGGDWSTIVQETDVPVAIASMQQDADLISFV
ncbi:MAG: hypothetical protein ACREMY_28985, partial [bacterium]